MISLCTGIPFLITTSRCFQLPPSSLSVSPHPVIRAPASSLQHFGSSLQPKRGVGTASAMLLADLRSITVLDDPKVCVRGHVTTSGKLLWEVRYLFHKLVVAGLSRNFTSWVKYMLKVVRGSPTYCHEDVVEGLRQPSHLTSHHIM